MKQKRDEESWITEEQVQNFTSVRNLKNLNRLAAGINHKRMNDQPDIYQVAEAYAIAAAMNTYIKNFAASQSHE